MVALFSFLYAAGLYTAGPFRADSGAAERAEEGKPKGATAGTFEDLLKSARPIRSGAELERVLDPLFAECAHDSDLDARQCAGVQQFLAAELRGETLVAAGDSAALSWSPYDPSSKHVELDVQGCIACAHPIPIGNKERFVTTRVPKAIKGGKATGLDVAFHEVAFPDPKTAARWEKQFAPRLRVQFIFKIGPLWKSGTAGQTYEGVSFVPIAHRIYDACNGQVAISDPPSQAPVPVSREEVAALKCPSAIEDLSPEERRNREEWEALPNQLSRQDVERAMAPIQQKVHDCYVEFEERGMVTARMTVDGAGKVDEVTVLAPFDKTPTGYCVKTAIRSAEMPRFRGDKMQITFPFYLR
jgi:hypothetical protein